MRWGIVGSGYETALVTSWLPDSVQVDVFLDWARWPRTAKTVDDSTPRVIYAVDYLLAQGVTHIIVPPLWEASLCDTYPAVVPLFQTYLYEVVLPASRIGKLCVLHGHESGAGKTCASDIALLASRYTHTANQQRTKTFLSPWGIWTKEVGRREMHLPYADRHAWMIQHLIKDDLRYCKDCAVDSLLPTERGFFYREKSIRHHLGSRMRFHGSQTIRPLLAKFCVGSPETGTPSVTVHTTADCDQFFANKTRKQRFNRGGKREVRVVEVEKR